MKREDFIRSGIMGISGILIPSVVQESQETIDPSLIKEFVVAGHNDLPKVKSMLKVEPTLLYSRHDWGNGDFEEAIEGAAHVGNVEIAQYLIEQGARVNLFTLTMLGKTNIVIPTLTEYPNLVNTKGPHGFTLLHHAKIGGEASKEIYNFLLAEGLEKLKI